MKFDFLLYIDHYLIQDRVVIFVDDSWKIRSKLIIVIFVAFLLTRFEQIDELSGVITNPDLYDPDGDIRGVCPWFCDIACGCED